MILVLMILAAFFQISKNNKKIKIFENEKRGLGSAINCGIKNSDKNIVLLLWQTCLIVQMIL